MLLSHLFLSLCIFRATEASSRTLVPLKAPQRPIFPSLSFAFLFQAIQCQVRVCGLFSFISVWAHSRRFSEGTATPQEWRHRWAFLFPFLWDNCFCCRQKVNARCLSRCQGQMHTHTHLHTHRGNRVWECVRVTFMTQPNSFEKEAKEDSLPGIIDCATPCSQFFWLSL